MRILYWLTLALFLISCQRLAENEIPYDQYDTLRIGYFETLDPNLNVRSPRSVLEYQIIEAVHLSLLQRDNGEQRLISGAARTWHIERDLTLYTFQIDQSLQFTNGNHLRCEDARLSLEEVKSSSGLSTMLDTIQKIGCDGDVLKIQLTRPTPNLLSVLADPIASIVQRNHDGSTSSLGGYTIKEMPNGVQLLKRPEKVPSLEVWSSKNIQILMLRTMEQAKEMFNRGELQIIDLVQRPEEAGNLIYRNRAGRIWMAIPLHESGRHSALLRCINAGINREKLSLLSPRTFPAYGFLPNFGAVNAREFEPSVPGTTACKKLAANKETFRIVSLSRDRLPNLAGALGDQLTSLGLDVQVLSVDRIDFLHHLKERSPDFAVFSYGMTDDPYEFLARISTSPFHVKLNSSIQELLQIMKFSAMGSQRESISYVSSALNWKDPVIATMLFETRAFYLSSCVRVDRFAQVDTPSFSRIAKIRGCSDSFGGDSK